MQKPFAEIIESNLETFLAQSWSPDISPIFGSLVEVDCKNYKAFGIVTSIQTGSMDPTRYPFIYQKTEEELKKEQPQIFEFLKTTFKVLVVGYHEKNQIYYKIPPTPCKIHSFVTNSNISTEKIFFSNNDFLYLTFSNQVQNLDELLLAILKNLKNKNLIDKNFLQNFSSTFSLLNGNDYKRLKVFLKRVEQI